LAGSNFASEPIAVFQMLDELNGSSQRSRQPAASSQATACSKNNAQQMARCFSMLWFRLF
jgi:hypothetical protein